MKPLDRIDYQDAFTIQAPEPRLPGQWARLALDAAPPALLSFARTAHRILGFRLVAVDEAHPLGWNILQDEAHVFVLGTEGPGGSARIVGSTPPGYVIVTTMIRFDTAGSRVAWKVIAPAHRAIARYMLDRTAKAAASERHRADGEPTAVDC